MKKWKYKRNNMNQKFIITTQRIERENSKIKKLACYHANVDSDLKVSLLEIMNMWVSRWCIVLCV